MLSMFEGLEDGDQDGETGGEHGQPFGRQSFQLQLIELPQAMA
jgi:hypothetical protein